MMPTWEYQTDITQLWLDPQELDAWGKIGWEMVGFQVVLAANGPFHYYVFKRPITEASAFLVEQEFDASANTVTT